MSHPRRVVVIGAGPGGLFPATAAAGSGRGVTVLVEIDPSQVAAYQPLFEGLMRELAAVYEDYTDEELELVAGWVERVTAAQQRATAALTTHAEETG